MRIALDQHELLQKYDYDPTTGILTRKHQVRNHAAGSVVGKIISSGYLQTTHNKKLVLVHRIIWTMMEGPIPDDKELDHKNHDKADNRWCNLRLVTRAQNQQNRRKRKQCSSRFKGVSKTSDGKWRAKIQVNGETIHLGTFTKELDACLAYHQKARELQQEYQCVL